MTVYGYCRCSTESQSLDGQQEALKAAGCEHIFAEKVSGKSTDNRPQLGAILNAMKAGDTLIVTRLDRLARSTRDLLNLLAAIAERGAFFRSVSDSWANSDTPHGRLMITILGGLAEFERTLILERTNEGRVRAQQAGKKFGRKHKLNLHQQAEARMRLQSDECAADIAKSYNVSEWTIRRLRSPEAPL